MKFHATLTTLLVAAAGLTSAAPAWGEPASDEAVASSPAMTLSKRAWPWGKGDCYGSGQWGKQEDGKHAIRDFCTKHAKGQVPPKGLKRTPDNQQPWLADEFSYNSSVKWIIRVVTSPLVSHGPALTYEECVISLYQAINYCWGNNQDTRGGVGFVRELYVDIDPESK